MSEWSARKCECSGEDACAFAVERDKALAQLAELREAAEDLVRSIAIVLEDGRIGYVEAQIDRMELNNIRAVLARQKGNE